MISPALKLATSCCLHGCCHNPCGADLSLEQWRVIAELAERQGFTPFVDFAYQGMGVGLDEDAAGLRLLVSRLPEVIVASSCSKNLGLYRERTGGRRFCLRRRSQCACCPEPGPVRCAAGIFHAARTRGLAGRASVYR